MDKIEQRVSHPCASVSTRRFGVGVSELVGAAELSSRCFSSTTRADAFTWPGGNSVGARPEHALAYPASEGNLL